MKNTTKRTVAAMSAAAMLISGGIISAYGEENTPPLDEPTAIAEVQESETAINHGYIVGRITVGVSDEENAIASEDGLTYIYKDGAVVLGADGSEKSFDDIEEGDVISYYVNGSAPMTLQYPPHYSADVIVIEDEEAEMFREIGIFNEELVNEENTLSLNISEDTVFYGTDRDSFKGGKALVFYGITTRSIPAQTNPAVVVKLADDGEIVEAADEGKEADLSGVKEIKAGGEAIAHIPVTVNGVQMLPVRVYAEALGFEVEWLSETETVNVGHASFNIAEDSYVIGKAMPQQLGQAPVLIALPGDSYATTYVPVTFFTEILGGEITVDGTTAEITVPVGE